MLSTMQFYNKISLRFPFQNYHTINMLAILFLCAVTIQLSILDCTFSLKTLFCNTNLVVMYVYMLFLVCHVHDVRE